MKRFGIALGSIAVLTGASALATAQQYKQNNIVANTAGVASNTDSSLVNPWGEARSSAGPWWLSDAGTGLSTLYNGAGVKQGLVVTVPKADPTNAALPHGLPSGIIANGSTTDFLLTGGKPADFIYSTLDGSLAGWNPAVGIKPGGAAPSTNAVTTYVGPKGSSYTGLTSALVNGERFLYAANFGLGTLDVFDNAFNPVKARQLASRQAPAQGDGIEEVPLAQSGPFKDDRLPNNYVPFNVQAIGNDLVVTYALHPAGSGPQETDGPGLGYVDIYSTTGKLLRRLEHGVWLNAPWGVALAPLDFGAFSHDLLVAQFGGAGNSESAGYIAAYDLATGKFDGLLQNASGAPLVIQGIWSLSPGNVSPNNLDPAAAPSGEIYFAAGPNGGANGLYGYISAVPTTLVQGNDQ